MRTFIVGALVAIASLLQVGTAAAQTTWPTRPIRFILPAVPGGGTDTLARTLAQVEIPLGILTAVIGTPFFIWLLASVQKNWS